jgi:hypothetical protein
MAAVMLGETVAGTVVETVATEAAEAATVAAEAEINPMIGDQLLRNACRALIVFSWIKNRRFVLYALLPALPDDSEWTPGPRVGCAGRPTARTVTSWQPSQCGSSPQTLIRQGRRNFSCPPCPP